ncbi:MAG: TrkA family potassium uptake protein [Clostridia bacterium]|nr:TrkA family potassium uptake protein [Clostridia bacterium]
MKSVLLIGMGRFGTILGERLMRMGDEVMIVDKDEAVINALAPKYTNALIANCMNADNLKALDIPSFDACVVSISDDFQSSLEITSILKDLGAKYVVSRANTEIQRKFLFRVGADEVVYPNHDIAEKLAVKLNSDGVYDYIEIDSEYSIFEIAIPQNWHGKTLIDENPRGKFGINILLIKKGKNIVPSPSPNYVFEDGDHILAFGSTEKILAFTNKTSAKGKLRTKKAKRPLDKN